MDSLLELPNFDSEDVDKALARFINSPHYCTIHNPHGPRDPHLSDDRVILFTIAEAIRKSTNMHEIVEMLSASCDAAHPNDEDEADDKLMTTMFAICVICGMIIAKDKERK